MPSHPLNFRVTNIKTSLTGGRKPVRHNVLLVVVLNICPLDGANWKSNKLKISCCLCLEPTSLSSLNQLDLSVFYPEHLILLSASKCSTKKNKIWCLVFGKLKSKHDILDKLIFAASSIRKDPQHETLPTNMMWALFSVSVTFTFYTAKRPSFSVSV